MLVDIALVGLLLMVTGRMMYWFRAYRTILAHQIDKPLEVVCPQSLKGEDLIAIVVRCAAFQNYFEKCPNDPHAGEVVVELAKIVGPLAVELAQAREQLALKAGRLDEIRYAMFMLQLIDAEEEPPVPVLRIVDTERLAMSQN